MLEEVLESEPYNRQANLLLKEAAVAAGWAELGVFALKTLLEENPRDVKALYELGRLYHNLGDYENEVEVYNQLSAIDPLDAQSLRLGKDASARASMKRGGWSEAESYRDLIKDKDEAISLEQKSRIRLTGEALDQQIAETYALHQAEPENVLEGVAKVGVVFDEPEIRGDNAGQPAQVIVIGGLHAWIEPDRRRPQASRPDWVGQAGIDHFILR